jgi:hypothetical protein
VSTLFSATPRSPVRGKLGQRATRGEASLLPFFSILNATRIQITHVCRAIAFQVLIHILVPAATPTTACPHLAIRERSTEKTTRQFIHHKMLSISKITPTLRMQVRHSSSNTKLTCPFKAASSATYATSPAPVSAESVKLVQATSKFFLLGLGDVSRSRNSGKS